MCDDLRAWTIRHVATRGRTLTGIPQIPSPAPDHNKTPIFRDNQKMESPNSIFLFLQKSWETTRHVVCTGALSSQKAGGGGGHRNTTGVQRALIMAPTHKRRHTQLFGEGKPTNNVGWARGCPPIWHLRKTRAVQQQTGHTMRTVTDCGECLCRTPPGRTVNGKVRWRPVRWSFQEHANSHECFILGPLLHGARTVRHLSDVSGDFTR